MFNYLLDEDIKKTYAKLEIDSNLNIIKFKDLGNYFKNTADNEFYLTPNIVTGLLFSKQVYDYRDVLLHSIIYLNLRIHYYIDLYRQIKILQEKPEYNNNPTYKKYFFRSEFKSWDRKKEYKEVSKSYKLRIGMLHTICLRNLKFIIEELTFEYQYVNILFIFNAINKIKVLNEKIKRGGRRKLDDDDDFVQQMTMRELIDTSLFDLLQKFKKFNISSDYAIKNKELFKEDFFKNNTIKDLNVNIEGKINQFNEEITPNNQDSSESSTASNTTVKQVKFTETLLTLIKDNTGEEIDDDIGVTTGQQIKADLMDEERPLIKLYNDFISREPSGILVDLDKYIQRIMDSTDVTNKKYKTVFSNIKDGKLTAINLQKSDTISIFLALLIAIKMKVSADNIKKIVAYNKQALDIKIVGDETILHYALMPKGGNITYTKGRFTSKKIILNAKNEDIISELISENNINIADNGGHTPLLVASRFSNNKKIITKLLEKNSNINQANVDGDTSLHLASSQGNDKVVEVLLEHAQDKTIPNFINLQNNKNMTALHLAVQNCHKKIVELLLNKDANKTITNKANKTPEEMLSYVPKYLLIKNILLGILGQDYTPYDKKKCGEVKNIFDNDNKKNKKGAKLLESILKNIKDKTKNPKTKKKQNKEGSNLLKYILDDISSKSTTDYKQQLLNKILRNISDTTDYKQELLHSILQNISDTTDYKQQLLNKILTNIQNTTGSGGGFYNRRNINKTKFKKKITKKNRINYERTKKINRRTKKYKKY